jgi:hypothetical protein
MSGLADVHNLTSKQTYLLLFHACLCDLKSFVLILLHFLLIHAVIYLFLKKQNLHKTEFIPVETKMMSGQYLNDEILNNFQSIIM